MNALTPIVESPKPAAPMNRDEKARFDLLDALIDEKLKDFVEVGLALAEISREHLYRDTHGTFADYIRDKFERSRIWGYQQIAGALAWENVNNCLQKFGPDVARKIPKPKNEAQARALTAFEDPDQQVDAWLQAVENAPDGKITARHVKETVQGIKGETRKKKVSKAKKKVAASREISPQMKTAFEAFVNEVQRAHDEGWKNDSKPVVLQQLNAIISFIEAD